jgi:(2Fe-2S) ferredoxin
MTQYDKHVFVCTHGAWCSRDGDTNEIVRRLKQEIGAAGLKGRVRVNRAGCFNQCGHGPMVVVYPAGNWYAGVAPEDAVEIVAEDIANGRIVSRLRYDAPPGDNKDLTRYPADQVAAEQARKDGS